MADSKSFIIFGFTQQRTQAKQGRGWGWGWGGRHLRVSRALKQAGPCRAAADRSPSAKRTPVEQHLQNPSSSVSGGTWRKSERGIRQLACSVPSNKSSGFTGGQWHLKSLSSNPDISSDLCHDLRSLNLLRLQFSHARGPYT